MINYLIEKIKEKEAPIVVGLDPKLSYVPKHIRLDAYAAYGETLEVLPRPSGSSIKRSLMPWKI